MRIAGMNLGSASLGTGVAIGAGVTLLAPLVYPLVGGLLKLTAKGVIKAGILAYEGGKDVVNKTSETFETLAAEARTELKGDAPVAKVEKKPVKSASKAKKQAKKTTEKTTA